MLEQKLSPREEKLTERERIERSLTKTYRKSIWNKFITGVKQYELVTENDHIMCCISGGKDSSLLAKCFQQLERITTFPFQVSYVCMDPGYLPSDRKKIEDNCKRLGIPVTFFHSDIYKIVKSMDDAPCYMCARMRRGNLYNHAQSIGCNKIALGHHLDDVVETLLMSMFYASELKTMPPKLKSSNFQGLELIRPLYQVKEADIIAWRNRFDLDFIHCGCPLSGDTCGAEGANPSKRAETKALLGRLKLENPSIEQNIFKSIHNVNLNTFPGYSLHGKKHSFLETYENSDESVPI